MYNLFLDDIRIPLDALKYTYNTSYIMLKWQIVRDYASFIKHIEKNGLPELVSFDHDLADEHYKIGARSGFAEFDYDLADENTGYECAKWLCEFCLKTKQKLPKFLIHSMNPVGKKNIQSYLDNYKKYVDEDKSRE